MSSALPPLIVHSGWINAPARYPVPVNPRLPASAPAPRFFGWYGMDPFLYDALSIIFLDAASRLGRIQNLWGTPRHNS